MGFLSDLLLAGGAFGAAIFCLVLSRRLKALTALDSGMGAAIAVLSAQVDDLSRALARAEAAANGTSGRLSAQTERAESAARKLELLVAALHDLPQPGDDRRPAAPGFADPMSDVSDHNAEAAPRTRLLRRRTGLPVGGGVA